MKSRELLYKNTRHSFYHVLQPGIFFQSLLAVTDQGRILSGSVVVGVHMLTCAHTCWWKALPVLLCAAKIILKSLPLSLKHLTANSRDKEKYKGGMQKAGVFMHKPEGGKNVFKRKNKSKCNDDFELPN